MKYLSQHLSDLHDKNVLVRVNYDVPLNNGQVLDTTRIEDSLNTIHALQPHAKSIILLAHAGRPDGKPHPESSLKPVALTLSSLLNLQVPLVDYATDISSLTSKINYPICLLENLRFWPGEEANDPHFSQSLAALAHAYVNESFAVCHRAHASMVGIPKLLPSYAGLSLSKEIDVLNQVIHNPKKPLVVVIGGAKLETKEPLVNAFLGKADHILVGGKLVQELVKNPNPNPTIKFASLTPNGRDITTQSAHEFASIINQAGTVIWNGTMGVFEEPENAAGTTIIAQAVNSTKAFTVVGGGDTETCLTQLKLEAGIDHISTGGGAMLEYLSKGELIALKALE